MPFNYILANLMAANASSVGVLFLDETGETVDLSYTDYSPADMKLVGAWVGIYVRQLERFLPEEEFGALDLLHIENEGLHVFARPLTEGYLLVLAQRSPCLTARSRRSLHQAGDELVREVFGQA